MWIVWVRGLRGRRGHVMWVKKLQGSSGLCEFIVYTVWVVFGLGLKFGVRQKCMHVALEITQLTQFSRLPFYTFHIHVFKFCWPEFRLVYGDPIFWVELMPQLLHLYVLPGYASNRRDHSWNLVARIFLQILTLEHPLPVPIFCNLKYISLYYIHNSMKIISK